jgi:hypothetical protein
LLLPHGGNGGVDQPTLPVAVEPYGSAHAADDCSAKYLHSEIFRPVCTHPKQQKELGEINAGHNR